MAVRTKCLQNRVDRDGVDHSGNATKWTFCGWKKEQNVGEQHWKEIIKTSGSCKMEDRVATELVSR